MKRSVALAGIKHCGYHGDIQKAALITAQNGIGKAASRKAFLDGQKLAGWGDPCDCPACTEKQKK